MKKRVVVFLDWQNVYMRARESFHSKDAPALKGQVDPVDLALVLVQDYARRHPLEECEFGEVRVYRGRPTQQGDAKGYAAFRRQVSGWGTNNKVRPFFNDLRYPDDWGQPGCRDKPREKGIDVALAVDLVDLGIQRLYDAAIVMSADYDLRPAIDLMVRRHLARGEGPAVEVAAWKGDHGRRPLRIKLDGRPLYCIWLDRQAYWGVMDERDYTVPVDTPRASGRPKPGPYRPRN